LRTKQFHRLKLSPEGGDGGGEIVCAGPPEEIVRVERSYTGKFLRPVLGRKVESPGKTKRTAAAE
jgi:excinuclease ABC subunit A